MNFDPSDPTSGQPLEDYLTVDYIKSLNAALRYALAGKNISGGPGVTTSQFGNKTTIKARRVMGGGDGGPPNTDTIPIGKGTGENEGYWVDVSGNQIDFIELDICVEGTVKKLRLLGMIID
jgi:hypothetical protein